MNEEMQNLQNEISRVKGEAAYSKVIEKSERVSMLLDAVERGDHKTINNVIASERRDAVEKYKKGVTKRYTPASKPSYAFVINEECPVNIEQFHKMGKMEREEFKQQYPETYKQFTGAVMY